MGPYHVLQIRGQNWPGNDENEKVFNNPQNVEPEVD